MFPHSPSSHVSVTVVIYTKPWRSGNTTWEINVRLPMAVTLYLVASHSLKESQPCDPLECNDRPQNLRCYTDPNTQLQNNSKWTRLLESISWSKKAFEKSCFLCFLRSYSCASFWVWAFELPTISWHQSCSEGMFYFGTKCVSASLLKLSLLHKRVFKNCSPVQYFACITVI